MKSILLYSFLIFLFKNSVGQSLFYLNDSIQWYPVSNPPLYANCKFTDDAIYFFYNSNRVTKTDYNGNIIWSKHIATNNIKVSGQSIYCTDSTNQKIMKLDTAGNFIWAKDFTALVYKGTTYLNGIADIIPNGNRLFALVNQTAPYPSTALDTYYSLLTLDTAGNFIRLWADTLGFMRTPQYLFLGSPHLSNRCWVAIEGTSGMFYQNYVISTDSNGYIDNSMKTLTYYYGDYNTIQDIIPMPDSTYLIIDNTRNQSFNALTVFVLSKIDRSGKLLWHNTYQSSYAMPPLGQNYAGAGYIDIDDRNNIYIIGYASMKFQTGYYGMKVDASGNIEYVKTWKFNAPNLDFGNVAGYSFNGMHYRNGHLYCFVNYHETNQYGHPGIIVFDTLFNSPCYSADTVFSLVQNAALRYSTTPWGQNPSLPYSPTNSSGVVVARGLSVSYPLCSATNISVLEDEKIIIYPNPLTTSATLQLNTQFINRLKDAEIIIYNTLGKEIMRKKLTGDRVEIERGNLASGIYFVRVVGGDRLWVEKMVVE